MNLLHDWLPVPSSWTDFTALEVYVSECIMAAIKEHHENGDVLEDSTCIVFMCNCTVHMYIGYLGVPGDSLLIDIGEAGEPWTVLV